MVLALVRCAYDSPYLNSKKYSDTNDSIRVTDSVKILKDSITSQYKDASIPLDKDFIPHKIFSVPSFKNTFPDSNNVQIQAAQLHGVTPVQNRIDAEGRKAELVYSAANPYYSVAPLRESIPYLVPRANILLQNIGKAFYDSLYIKGIPMHQIIVTSMLRTE